jgi:hypothetical protein
MSFNLITSRKLLLIAVAACALTTLGGCKKAAAPEVNTNTGAQGQPPAGGTAAVVETKFFRGSIGNALDLQMKLQREGDALTGSYFYQKVGQKIDLRGTIDKDGNVTLDEFDASGKQTGTFKGQWKTGSDGAVEISGNWAKPNSDKKTPFSLQQEPIEFSSGVDIAAKQIKESNKKLKYEIAATYPQLTGSTDPNFEKFNQTVRGLVNRNVGSFKKDVAPENEPTPDPSLTSQSEEIGSDIQIAYTIALAKDDLISVEFSISSYYAGAAHPNSASQTLNFDLRNGKQLKLADLFQPGSKYLQTISAYCVKELTAQAQKQGADGMLDEEWIHRGAGAEADNYQNWTVTKKGLAITFDPYQVAPYAAGPQYVTVPYSSLKDIIKPDGPIGQFGK